MRNLISFIIGLSVATACSMGAKSPNFKEYPSRKDESRAYEFCKDSYNDGKTVIDNPTGKLCSSYCPKDERKKDGKCKIEKKVVIKNTCETEQFLFFRSGAFLVLPEKYL